MAVYTLSLNPDKEKKTSITSNRANGTNDQQQRRDTLGSCIECCRISISVCLFNIFWICVLVMLFMIV